VSLRPKHTYLAALLVTLVSAFLFATLTQREPRYQGKALRQWVQQYRTNHWSNARESDADKRAQEAIRAIGTNGIPFLVEWMHTPDSSWKTKLREVVPRRWQSTPYLQNVATGERRRIGANGLAVLGQMSKPAVPALMELARHHPDNDARYVAVWTLGKLGDAARPAIPLLIECLTNEDSAIRGDAALGLGSVHLNSETVVPALVRYLEFAKTLNGNGELCTAISAVGLFGTNAKPAIPALLPLLNHSDVYVRTSVTNYLPMIDREIAARAGVHLN